MKTAIENGKALQTAADYSLVVFSFGRNTRKSAAQASKGVVESDGEAWAQWLDPSPPVSQPQALFG